MKKNKYIIVFFFLLCLITYSQNIFHYSYFVKGEIREGVLLYDKNIDQAVYIDLLSTTKKTQKTEDKKIKEDVVAVITARTTVADRFFYKRENKLKFTQGLLKTMYLVDDETLEINWKLDKIEKEIEGLKCQKATTQFRGREWEVWYTTEIPMYYGPWKFYGLPGLIVLAKENNNEFWFKLERTETKNKVDIPVVNVKDYKRVTLQEFDKDESEIMEGKDGIASRNYNEEIKPYKRNGIELIYEWEE
ncbi:GLPGLI family protein [Paenimyroides aquimaris]|uniref:GLPGLI family protein n=1 Tax=Paenimyroides marinum TaxID=1159016 RepID=A0A1H6JC80_9FLAO|nr:GLPGLI family protein [Paenimyroides aquimaris]SEH59739.1 GLPGLI family protein [Paenimyroides aquimaris]